jgi:hypothetical protein
MIDDHAGIETSADTYCTDETWSIREQVVANDEYLYRMAQLYSE